MRLLVAITSYSKVRIDQESPKTSQSKKLWELGKWIVTDLVADGRHLPVLIRYRAELDGSTA